MSGPPNLAVRFMEFSLAPVERAAVLGDLQENFSYRHDAVGSRAAAAWYWQQTLRSFGPNLARRVRRDRAFRRVLLEMSAAAMLMVVFVPPRVDHRFTPEAVSGFLAALYFINSRRLPWGDSPLEFAARVALDFCAVLMVLVAAGPMAVVVACGMRPFGTYPRTVNPKDTWFVRGPAVPGELPYSHLTAAIPDRPLGLSGIVLVTDVPVDGTVSPQTFNFLRAGVPTIRREFSRGTTLRVFTAAYVQGRAIAARLDVIAADGRVQRSIEPVVTAGDMEQVRQPWGREATFDSHREFARIDAQLPLADFEPGRYEIRLTITDGAYSTTTEDAVTVYESPAEQKA